MSKETCKPKCEKKMVATTIDAIVAKIERLHKKMLIRKEAEYFFIQ